MLRGVFSRNEQTERSKISLIYNGKLYHLKEGDILGLGGTGRIAIQEYPGGMSQSISGSFSGSVQLKSLPDGAYLNGVALSELVKTLQRVK